MEDKLDPSIRYLQKLGPEYIDQIFASSRWIFNLDPDRAFQVNIFPMFLILASPIFSRFSPQRMSNFPSNVLQIISKVSMPDYVQDI